jgi:hypothetical protein
VIGLAAFCLFLGQTLGGLRLLWLPEPQMRAGRIDDDREEPAFSTSVTSRATVAPSDFAFAVAPAMSSTST